MKLYIQIGGGLGDLYRCYFGNPSAGLWGLWGKVEEICKKLDLKPKSIDVIGSTHNINQCKLFLEHHPYIRDFYLDPWVMDGTYLKTKFEAEGYKNLSTYLSPTCEWSQPSIYLTDAERAEIDTIKADPYVVLYPYLGCPDLEPWPVENYYPMVDSLIDRGFKVVVLGGSYQRIWRQNENGQINDENGVITIRNLVQEFPNDKVINCIGRGSRLSAQLVIDSSLYIGTFGCYTMVAHTHKKRNIILHENVIADHFIRHNNDLGSDCFAINEPFTRKINVVGKSIEEVTKQTLDLFDSI